MRPPRQREAAKSDDLFRARLEQIMDMKHELVQLTGKIDWAWIDSQITPLYSARAPRGRRPGWAAKAGRELGAGASARGKGAGRPAQDRGEVRGANRTI
jgi:hypothetical protein